MVKEMNQRAAGRLSLPHRLFKFMTSMPGGILLLLLLSLLSVYGSLFPHPDALELVYRSWWYRLVFILTAFNLLACTLRRLNRLVRGFRSTSPVLSAYSYRIAVKVPGEGKVPPKRAEDWLQRNSYRLRSLMLPQGQALVASKGRAGIYGFLVTHLALLLILAAAYYGVLTGSEDLGYAFPGEKIPVTMGGEPYFLEVVDFYIAYRDDGTVQQYYSEVILRPQDPTAPAVAGETIYVNQPLRYGRKVFYQHSYGWGVEADLYHPPSGAAEQVLLIPGEGYYFAPAGLTMQLLQFNPELEEDDQELQFSPSPEPLHPHVLFRLLDLENQPIGPPALLLEIEQPLKLPRLELTFTDYQKYTGILISENRSKGYVLMGSIMFLGGLFLSFYMRSRQIILLWSHASGPPTNRLTKDELTLYGWFRHDREGFEAELQRFLQALESEGRDGP